MLDDDYSFENADYPPYNIVRTGENSFRISLALPGNKPDQLNIVAHQNVLTVAAKADEQTSRTICIAASRRGRSSAASTGGLCPGEERDLTDGMLQIDLAREVPEQLKPRRIEINAAKAKSDNVTTIDQKKAS